MTQLVALLRGVNLGKRKVKMDDLRKSFAAAGFAHAQTLLASGNVVFDGKKSDETAKRIERQLKTDFGFEVETILRTMGELKTMASTGPFSGLKSDKDKKHYVYFLGTPEGKAHPLPPPVPGDFDINEVTEYEIFATGYRLPNGRFGPGLDKLSKPFGRYMTNRNWNTVLRLLQLEQSS